jgi:uroporphyrinogen decarboxylase
MTRHFDGFRVVSFESRRSGEMARLIERFGGVARSAPSMRELPIPQSPEAFAFGEALLAGRVDTVIFLTGVGARTLMSILEQKYPRQQIIDALARVRRVARGPKPVAAMREWGLTPTLLAPEPNTWRELLAAMDADGPVAGQRIAVQEYGQPNRELAEALRERGAEVTSIAVYTWALPEDVGPLREAIQAIIDGQAKATMFTSAQQVTHVLMVAREMGVEAEFREAMKRTLIASIGPTCSEALRDAGLGVDFEPDRTHMMNLVSGLARSARLLLERKRASHAAGVDTSRMRRVDAVWPSRSGVLAATTDHRGRKPDPAETSELRTLLHDSPFLKACRREPTDYTPIWIMRQAGRFLREYRELRAEVTFLELCKTPELAAEVTLMAVERLGVDAAIIFADILLVAEPLGAGLTFDAGEGPRIGRPVRERADVDRLQEVEPAESLTYVADAVRLTRRALPPGVPLIGFCGAPFTVASYLIEGGGSRHFQHTKTLMYRDSGAWHALMEKLSRALAKYLNMQIAAGAQAVQLFDSWVGCLSEPDYRTFVLPHVKALIEAITPGTPVIYFGTDTAVLLKAMREAGGQVIGLDWRVQLDQAWETVGHDVAVQGNLDPTVLFATPSEIQRRARAILDQVAGRPGHVFNLGHGVLPTTPVDSVLALIDAVHEYRHG